MHNFYKNKTVAVIGGGNTAVANALELANICDVSIEAATFRLKRFNEIKGRERFYTNPREQQLYQQLKEFIINKRKE